MQPHEILSALCATAGVLALAPLAFHRRPKLSGDSLQCISETGIFSASRVHGIPPMRSAGVEPDVPWPRAVKKTSSLTPAAPVITDMPEAPSTPPPNLNLDLDFGGPEPKPTVELVEMGEQPEPLRSAELRFRRGTSRSERDAGLPTLSMAEEATSWRARRVNVGEAALIAAWLGFFFPHRLTELGLFGKPAATPRPLLIAGGRVTPRKDASLEQMLALALEIGLRFEPIKGRSGLAGYRVTPLN